MNLLKKISKISVGLLMLLSLSITYTDALSIEGESSSYQITVEGQPVTAPKPSAPKVIPPKIVPKAPVVTPAPVPKVAQPVQKKIVPVPKAPAPKVIKLTPLRASAPNGEATGELLKSGVASSIAVFKNIPIIDTIQSTIEQIAERSETTLHSSAPDIASQMSSLLQYLTFAAFLFLAFGLGMIATPLKR